jgi:hypothetical protein
MSLTSYAPALEDVTLWRLLRHVTNGFYIDIGPLEPGAESTSLAFYELGWKGVHVVPDLDALASRRPHSASGFMQAGPAMTLDALFRQLGAEAVHCLRLDLRNASAVPFSGWTDAGTRPWVVLVHLSGQAQGGAPVWEAQLLDKGYRLVGASDDSRAYVHAECPLAETLQGDAASPSSHHQSAATEPAETPLQYLYARMQKAEQAARDTSHRLAEVEAKLAQAEARAAQAELDTLAALAEARQIAILQHQLHDVYASTSWQVTKPMRWLSRLRRSPRTALPELGRVSRSMTRRLGSAITRRLIDVVRANPSLKRVALRFPTVVQRFQGHIREDLATMSPAPQAMPAPAPANRTTVLGPRFRALILDEIQRYEDPQYQGKL